MSTTERDKCGLSSLLPMSCRDRADAFARNLHSRLRSLNSEDGGSSADESSWLAANEVSMAVSHQPRHSSDPDLYFNFGLLESPGSPEEEIPESEISTLINNKDNLNLSYCENCNCPKNQEYVHKKAVITNSHDSDSSDGPYYDTVSEVHHKIGNCLNGVSEGSEDSGNSIGDKENHLHESPSKSFQENVSNESGCESPITSDLTTPPTDDDSTLSLKDEDYPSLEYNSAVQDLPHIESNEQKQDTQEETYSSRLNIEKDLTVECPTANVQITKCDSLDKESPKETSQTFLEVNSFMEDEENDDDKGVLELDRAPRVRRCSSLKTGKTPPGTPGRKKIVRFADVLGLDLAEVRSFLDEIPKIPTSAYDDLVDVELSASASDISLNSATQKFQASAGHKPERILMPLFQQPGGQPNFLDKVREKSVCLENAVVSDPIDLAIKGTVRVRNLDFHKSVHIRYTLDSWKTYSDLQATYIENTCDGFSDTFSFLLYAHTLTVGEKIEFAVRFQCKGCQYWDNNHGANYCFQCLPSTNTGFLSNGNYDDHWGASFYYQNDENEPSEDVEDHSFPDPDSSVNRKAVREFVSKSLSQRRRWKQNVNVAQRRKNDVVTVFVIFVFSIFFMYLQSTIF